MNIHPNRWNIIIRIIREYPVTRREVDDLPDCVYRDRAVEEINAVETALRKLTEEEQVVIAERFWQDRRRCMPYEVIERRMKAHYSVRQMKRITVKMMKIVGKELGHIE